MPVPQASADCREGCDVSGSNTFLGNDALLNNLGGNNTAVGANTLLINVSFGAMPNDMFMEQVRRFGRDVLPKLQAHKVKRVPAAG